MEVTVESISARQTPDWIGGRLGGIGRVQGLGGYVQRQAGRHLVGDDGRDGRCISGGDPTGPAQLAVEAMQRRARETGADKLTPDDVNAEIEAARGERRK